MSSNLICLVLVITVYPSRSSVLGKLHYKETSSEKQVRSTQTAGSNHSKSTYTVTADQLVAWPGFRHDSLEQAAPLFGKF